METLHYSTTLTTLSCGKCRIPFAMPSDMYKRRLEDGKIFYCPNGHNIRFTVTENAQLKSKIERLEQCRSWDRDTIARQREEMNAEKRKHAATKGKLTKTRKRVANGVCPCCNRQFTDLARHMKSKHPTYGTDANEDLS